MIDDIANIYQTKITKKVINHVSNTEVASRK